MSLAVLPIPRPSTESAVSAEPHSPLPEGVRETLLELHTLLSKENFSLSSLAKGWDSEMSAKAREAFRSGGVDSREQVVMDLVWLTGEIERTLAEGAGVDKRLRIERLEPQRSSVFEKVSDLLGPEVPTGDVILTMPDAQEAPEGEQLWFADLLVENELLRTENRRLVEEKELASKQAERAEQALVLRSQEVSTLSSKNEELFSTVTRLEGENQRLIEGANKRSAGEEGELLEAQRLIQQLRDSVSQWEDAYRELLEEVSDTELEGEGLPKSVLVREEETIQEGEAGENHIGDSSTALDIDGSLESSSLIAQLRSDNSRLYRQIVEREALLEQKGEELEIAMEALAELRAGKPVPLGSLELALAQMRENLRTPGPVEDEGSTLSSLLSELST